jgi:molecular chaperone DnaK (HSP70)
LGLHLFQGEKIGSGEVTKFTAVPLLIGVDVFGTMETMIPIGKELPIMAKRIFTTANDNQSDVDIKYVQPFIVYRMQFDVE